MAAQTRVYLAACTIDKPARLASTEGLSLVERLRRHAQSVAPSAMHSACCEAADEIERLRDDRDSWAQQASDRVADAVALVAAERERCRKLVEQCRACDWRVDDDGVWFTGCGHAWQFEDGGPAENGTKWCPYCGGRLAEAHNV